MSTEPCPTVYEAMLDAPAYEQLFSDYEALPTVEVSIKRAATAYADDKMLTLADARNALESGSARAIQLRYHFEGATWCDTLLKLPTGTRVVRVTLPSVESAHPT